MFRDAEIGVALELFDETFSGGADAPAPGDGEVRSPDGSYRFLGAFGGDTLLGFACWGPTPATDRTWDLYWIAVHAAEHRRGVGSLLMSEVESRIARAGARLVVVETSSGASYDATRRFYLRRRYVEAARVRGFYAPEDDRVIFVGRFPDAREGGAAA